MGVDVWREGEKGKQMWFRDFFFLLIFKTISHHLDSTPPGVNWSSAIDCSGSRARSDHETFCNNILICYIIESSTNFVHCYSFWNWKLSGMGEHHGFWNRLHKSQHRYFVEVALQVLRFAAPYRDLWCSWHIIRVLLSQGWHTRGEIPLCNIVRSEDCMKLWESGNMCWRFAW